MHDERKKDTKIQADENSEELKATESTGTFNQWAFIICACMSIPCFKNNNNNNNIVKQK